MPRYMIELSHSAVECVEALDEFEPRASDLLGETYWGCMSGRHAGWVVVEAESESAAREMVPPSVRDKVTVTEVRLVTPELAQAIEMEAAHPGIEEPFTS